MVKILRLHFPVRKRLSLIHVIVIYSSGCFLVVRKPLLVSHCFVTPFFRITSLAAYLYDVRRLGTVPSRLLPLFQSEAKCAAIDMKMIFFIFTQIKLVFTILSGELQTSCVCLVKVRILVAS